MLSLSGHIAILCLALTLIAGPIRRLWSLPLTHRRALGVSSFILVLVHLSQVLENILGYNFQTINFLPPQDRLGIWMGLGALSILTPLALTSSNGAQRRLGIRRWRSLHRFSIYAFVLAVAHTIVMGPRYLGQTSLIWTNYGLTLILGLLVAGVLLVRSPWFRL